MPKVSIIMNCFNGEQYLKEAIKSIIVQTYKNWELIFWDNQSTDNSKKIFKSFKDNRLKYFYSKDHTNLYEARNRAIMKSSGEILAFLDTDDVWLKDKLEKQIKIFKNKKINLVYSNYYVQKKLGFFNFKKLARNKNLPSGLITNDILKDYSVGLLTIAIRKNSLKKKKIFNTKLNLVSDFDFVLKFSLKNYFKSVQRPLAVYRIHRNQQQKTYFYKQLKDYVSLYYQLKKKKIFTSMSNFKFIKDKVIFYKEIERKKRRSFLSNLLSFYKVKNLKNRIKLFLFLFFENFAIKHIFKVF